MQALKLTSPSCAFTTPRLTKWSNYQPDSFGGFSPDGKWLLFDKRPDRNGYQSHEIWFRPVDPVGSAARRLVGGDSIYLAWSPDMAKIAVSSLQGVTPLSFPDGAQLNSWIIKDYRAVPIAWSPNGEYFAAYGYISGVQLEALFVIWAPTANETPPYLLATPKPITYSLESTADWLPYENSRLGLSLKYPETPPEQVRSSNKGYEWETLNVWIRTGPTLPAVWTNTAFIAIAVHPNPERLPVAEAVMKLDTLYGPLASMQPNETETRILENLRLAGAEQVQVFGSAFPKPLYGATRGVRLYVLGVGAMTDSEAQDRVFELLTTTLRFSD